MSSLGIFLAFTLASCGGSAQNASSSASVATPTPTTQGGWQLVLTVPSPGISYGIPGIALDGQGDVFIAELDDNRIYKYATSGKLLAQWGEPGSGPGQLGRPDKLAFDSQGNLYVTEVSPTSSGTAGGNSRVQKFSPAGKPLAQWGSYGAAPGQFNNPIGIAVDQQGDIFVSEEGGDRVQKLSASGQPLAQWALLVAVRGSSMFRTTSPSIRVGTFTSQNRVPLRPGTIGSRSSPPPECRSRDGEGLAQAPGSSAIQPVWP